MNQSRSRAQLILVAGVGIAVAFVALALILNTVVYTENLVTRQADDGQNAIIFERTAEDGVGGLISQLNYFDYASYDGLARGLERSVGAWNNQSAQSEASRGAITSVELVGIRNGSHILQESTDRPFVDAESRTDWALVSDGSGVRRFRMDISQTSLNTSTDSPFRVVVSNASTSWTVEIRENGTDSQKVTVAVNSQLCTRGTGTDDRVSVDLSGGTINGTECSPLTTIPWTNVTTVEYQNGDSIQGRYTLFVNERLDQLRASLPDNTYSGTVGTDPYVVRAIYGATLNLSVHDDQLSYTSTVEVTLERPAGGETYDVYQNTRELVYVSDSTNLLSSVHPNGTITRYDVPNASAIGPKEIDFDDDGLKEVPYVNGSNTLKLIDANNDTQELASGAKFSNSLLGIGDWDGDGAPAVFYVNTSDGVIYRTEWTGGTQDTPEMVGSGHEATAIAGIADYNDDGNADIIYTGTSANVKYLDGSGEVPVGRTVGSSAGMGIGAPRQHDGGGLVRIPIVDGSNNVGLLSYENDKRALTSSGPATKAPVAGVNWVGGGGKEVVYIEASSDTLYYATLGGATEQVTSKSGPIKVVLGPGVA